jgi:hypothetical protein
MSSSLEAIQRLSERAQDRLISAARDSEPVRGLTHDFYKYPARFSPTFARAAIETFTKPGQLVFDPHVGGGTTIVEARALGREVVGIDISPLAEFVARVKSTILSGAELDTLAAWGARLPDAVDIHRISVPFSRYAQLGYYKHLDDPSRWRLRKGVEQALASAIRLGTPRREAFARCVILRAAQWALDGRSKPTGIDEFRQFLGATAAEMVEGARELRATVKAVGHYPVTILHRSAAGSLRSSECFLHACADRCSGRLVPARGLAASVQLCPRSWVIQGTVRPNRRSDPGQAAPDRSLRTADAITLQCACHGATQGSCSASAYSISAFWFANWPSTPAGRHCLA